MNPATAAEFGRFNWHNASDREVARLVARSRGEELHRSSRGFGYRHKKNEIAPGLSTYRDGWYYDSFSVAAGAAFPNQTVLFATPQGQGGKTLASTNLTGQGGQIPSGETLQLNSIRLYISNTTTPADLQNILQNCSIQFLIKNYPVYQSIPAWFPAGFGGVALSMAQVGTAPAGAAAVTSITNGMPVQTAAYEFKYPYQMESQLNFQVLITANTAFNMVAGAGTNPLGVGTTIYVFLEGFKQQVVVS